MCRSDTVLKLAPTPVSVSEAQRQPRRKAESRCCEFAIDSATSSDLTDYEESSDIASPFPSLCALRDDDSMQLPQHDLIGSAARHLDVCVRHGKHEIASIFDLTRFRST